MGVVRRYIDIPIIIITFGSSSFLKCFSFLFVIFVQYSECCSKSIRDRSKIEITRTYVDARVRESQDFHMRGTARMTFYLSLLHLYYLYRGIMPDFKLERVCYIYNYSNTI